MKQLRAFQVGCGMYAIRYEGTSPVQLRSL